MRIPEKGIPKDELFEKMQAYRADDMNWRDGRVWAYVYDPGREAEEVIKQAYMMYLSENALDPTVFPSVLRFENELVAMAASHLDGDDDVVGNFTSGGTESIILAVKTARDYARAERPEIREPEIVLPVDGARGLPEGGATTSASSRCWCRSIRRRFKADVDGDAARHHAEHDPAGRLGGVVRPRRGRSDPRARAARAGARPAAARRRLHGRLPAALLPPPRRAGARLRLQRARRDLDVDGLPQVRLRGQGRLDGAVPQQGAAQVPDLHLRPAGPATRSSTRRCRARKSAGPLAAAWAVLNFIGDDGYLEIARQVLEATRTHRRRHRRDGRPAPAGPAGDEPGGLHVRHGERLPHHRRDEGSAAGTSSRSSASATRRRTSTCRSTRRASDGSTPCSPICASAWRRPRR